MKPDPSSDSAQPDLVVAARSLSEALERFDGAVTSAGRRPFTSRRSLEAATAALQEAATCEAALAEHIQALQMALATAGEQQRRQSARARALAEELQTQMRVHGEFMDRLGAIGNEAGALAERAREVTRARDRAAWQEVEIVIAEIGARLTAVAEDASRLWREAREGGFEEVAREAHSFAQTLLAIRNKVGRTAVPQPPQ